MKGWKKKREYMGKLEAEERHGAQKIKLVLVSRYMQKKDEKKDASVC